MTNIVFSKYYNDAIMKTEVFVALKFDITRKQIHSPSRRRDIVEARYVSYYLLNKLFEFPTTLIAQVFAKTHSSVIHGIKSIEGWGWDGEVVRQFKVQYQYTRKPQVIPSLSTEETANNNNKDADMGITQLSPENEVDDIPTLCT